MIRGCVVSFLLVIALVVLAMVLWAVGYALFVGA